MDWKFWVGKSVRVVLIDGYVKHGLFLGADGDFIEIAYERSKGQERIAISQIVSIKENGGR